NDKFVSLGSVMLSPPAPDPLTHRAGCATPPSRRPIFFRTPKHLALKPNNRKGYGRCPTRVAVATAPRATVEVAHSSAGSTSVYGRSDRFSDENQLTGRLFERRNSPFPLRAQAIQLTTLFATGARAQFSS